MESHIFHLTVDEKSAADAVGMVSGFATIIQVTSVLQTDQSLRPSLSAAEVYEQMMIFHTDLSADHRDCVLGLMKYLGWPISTQEVSKKGIGSWSGPQFAWTNANHELLVALHSAYGLTWQEIADAFFVDQLEGELGMQYGMLSQEGDAGNSVELD